MGVSLLCQYIDEWDDCRYEELSVKSLSFNGRDIEEPKRMKSYNSANMMLEGSLSFSGRELNTAISLFKSSPPSSNEGRKNASFVRQASFKEKNTDDQLDETDTTSKGMIKSPAPHSGNRRYQAALKLQKVYKSFRTRRQLADCAVLVEQRWWKVLDFAELKRSSISFFDIEKPETAVSRWTRATTKASKVGKGLSKDEKARKLALQHWLEAIDPRHRYGHNLQFYYLKWLHCESKQPFFYWLDIGEGKEVGSERCPRPRLQQQCIKYLGPAEREVYEVLVENGKFNYKQSGQLLDTRGGPKEAKWIFVLSTSKTLYVGMKSKGTFQHSSFLAGGATLSAGRLVVEDGILKAVWPHSGHYLPTEENFQEFMSFLKEHSVDLTDVKKSPTDEDDQECIHIKKRNITCIPQNPSDADFCRTGKNAQDGKENLKGPMSRLSRGLRSKITRLEIPKIDDSVFMEMLNNERKEEQVEDNEEEDDDDDDDDQEYCASSSDEEDGYETAEESFFTEQDFICPKLNLFVDDDDEDENSTPISKEQILERINSHRRSNSYQLARQLTSKWTTGAGPRIGCMRDYPSELQFMVLEQANLSPRSRTHILFSPKILTPTKLYKQTTNKP